MAVRKRGEFASGDVGCDETDGNSGGGKRPAVSAGGLRGAWNEDDHRNFVEAVYEIGLKNSSPAVIMENMSEGSKMITSERIKSKLQKYRNNKEKSKQDFMGEYDLFMQRANAFTSARLASGADASSETILQMMGLSKPLGGEAAAYVAYTIMRGNEPDQTLESTTQESGTRPVRRGALELVEDFGGKGIRFPALSEEEKGSSLGMSMMFVMGLFFTMKTHLMTEREKSNLNPEAGAKSGDGDGEVEPDQPVVVDGFTREPPPNQLQQPSYEQIQPYPFDPYPNQRDELNPSTVMNMLAGMPGFGGLALSFSGGATDVRVPAETDRRSRDYDPPLRRDVRNYRQSNESGTERYTSRKQF